eukprot:COSAG06_NODE_1232_length_10153_cov_24.843246_3_plen_98_part_00
MLACCPTLAAAVYACRSAPVVLEASYTPDGEPPTPLQQRALDAGCEVIDGRQMLVEQGLAQWELWTGQVIRSHLASALCLPPPPACQHVAVTRVAAD